MAELNAVRALPSDVTRWDAPTIYTAVMGALSISRRTRRIRAEAEGDAVSLAEHLS